jgi:hypothetical protein
VLDIEVLIIKRSERRASIVEISLLSFLTLRAAALGLRTFRTFLSEKRPTRIWLFINRVVGELPVRRRGVVSG